MAYTFYNRKYSLPSGDQEEALFSDLWQVEADDSYRVHHNGWNHGGVFITYGGVGIIRFFKQREPCYEAQLGPSSIIVVSPQTSCVYRCPGPEWRFFFFCLSGTAFLAPLSLPLNSPVQSLPSSQIHYSLTSMINEITEQRLGYLIRLNALFLDFLVRSARTRPQYNDRCPIGIRRALTWMSRHVNSPFSLERVLDISVMGRTRFFREFRRQTGWSPQQYFFELKLNSARYLLETTCKTVTDIADGLGFYDLYYFSKRFKGRYGISPREWRRQYQD